MNEDADGSQPTEAKPISERTVLWRMFLIGFVLLIVCIGGFILSGFGVLWMFAAATCAVFSFLALMIAVME